MLEIINTIIKFIIHLCFYKSQTSLVDVDITMVLHDLVQFADVD